MNQKNIKHNEDLENCFYTESFYITSNSGEKLGRISIYISDENLKKELDKIVFENVKNTILLSLILIIFLFITIHIFILKPISHIIETIGKSDKEGIPLKSISDTPIIEIDNLANSINKMVISIKKIKRNSKKRTK